MRRLLGLGMLVAVTAACGGTQGRVSYSARIQKAEALARRYPGAPGRYGVWAGSIPLWSLVNFELSVAPSRCASLRSPACRAWIRYFRAERQGLRGPALQRVIWSAHTAAIVDGLRTNRRALAGIRTTTLERNFWASWIEVVFVLAALNFPTDSAAAVPASNLLMPRCSPLGARACPMTRANLGARFTFVSVLAHRPASIRRILELYRLGPAAVLARELQDPAIAVALSQYVAPAPLD
jgi:hypothetical protein